MPWPHLPQLIGSIVWHVVRFHMERLDRALLCYGVSAARI